MSTTDLVNGNGDSDLTCMFFELTGNNDQSDTGMKEEFCMFGILLCMCSEPARGLDTPWMCIYLLKSITK